MGFSCGRRVKLSLVVMRLPPSATPVRELPLDGVGPREGCSGIAKGRGICWVVFLRPSVVNHSVRRCHGQMGLTLLPVTRTSRERLGPRRTADRTQVRLSKFHPSCIQAGAETHPRMHCLRRPTNSYLSV